MPTVISVENLSKFYHLGQINTPSPANACAGRSAGTFNRVEQTFMETV